MLFLYKGTIMRLRGLHQINRQDEMQVSVMVKHFERSHKYLARYLTN